MSEPVELPPIEPYEIEQFLQKRFSGGRNWLPGYRIVLGTHQWLLYFARVFYQYGTFGLNRRKVFDMYIYRDERKNGKQVRWYVQEDGTFSQKPYFWAFNRNTHHFVLPDLIEALEFANRCEKAFFKKRGQAMVCRKCSYQLSCLAQSE